MRFSRIDGENRGTGKDGRLDPEPDPSGIVYYIVGKDKNGSQTPVIKHVGKDKLKIDVYSSRHGFTTSHVREKEAVMADLKAKHNMVQYNRTHLNKILKVF